MSGRDTLRVWACALTLVLALAGATRAQDAASFEDMLPATTVFTLTLKNPSSQPAYLDSAFHKIAQQPEMKAFDEHVKAEVGRLLQVYQRQIPFDVGLVLDLLQGEVSVAFTGLGMGEQGPEPGIVISIVSPKGPEDAERMLLAAIRMALHGAQPAVQPGFDHDGQNVKAIALPMGKLYATRVGDRLVAAYGKSTMLQVLTFAKTKVGTLSTQPTFKTAAAKTGWTDAMARLYLNTTVLFMQFGAMMPPNVADTLQAYGLNTVQAVAATSRFADGGIRDAVYIHQPGPRGGFIPAAGNPVDLALLKAVPKNCSMFSLASVDIPKAYDQVMALIKSSNANDYKQTLDALGQAEAQLGFSIRDDLVGSMGRQMLVSFTPYQTVLGIELKEPAQFEGCLEQMAALAPGKVTWGEIEYRGQRIRHLDILAAPMPICPSYTIYGKFAVIGLFPQTLKAFIDQTQGDRGSILDNKDFQRTCGKFLKGCDSIGYVNAAGGLKGFYTLLVMAAQAMHGVPQVQLRGELMPHPNVLDPYLFGVGSGTINTADGLLAEYYSPVGSLGAVLGLLGGLGDMNQVAGPQLLAASSVMTAMLLPALARARGEARKAVCKSNIKQIGLAMAMYQNDFNEQTPNKLDDLYDQYITAKQIFKCPQDNRPMTIGQGIQCSYIYVGRTPRTTDPQVAILWDKRGNHRRGRNVLFYDGSVRWVPEFRLRRVLNDSLQRLQRNQEWPQMDPQRRAAIETVYRQAR